MANGVAHDFNNLLVPILANAGSLLAEIPPDSPLRDRLEAIETAARLSADLTDQILATTGRSMPASQESDVSSVVRSMRPLLDELVGPSVKINCELARPALALIDDKSLTQLLTNLVLNGSQAIGVHPGSVSITVAVEGNDHVVLSVADNGCGMTDDQIERMVEPFYTTRPDGRGLGLASLAGLVGTGRAELEVSSELELGTVVRVSFKTVESLIDLTQAGPELRTKAVNANVMIVDDNDLVRETLHVMLAKTFSSVMSTGSIDEAVAHVRGHGPIDCVVTDLTMPTLSGPKLITVLRAIQPDMSALLVTGAGRLLAEDALRAEGLAHIDILTKPFRPTDLVSAVAAVTQHRKITP